MGTNLRGMEKAHLKTKTKVKTLAFQPQLMALTALHETQFYIRQFMFPYVVISGWKRKMQGIL